MSNNIAIKVDGVSKYYRLGQINTGTLFRDIQSYMAVKRGKEDPNGKIGNSVYSLDGSGFYALRDISFEIEKGDRVGIIGRNGAGKSTLLKIISQITRPSSGMIGINGRVASLLEVGTGFNPEMTGRENIYLNGAILGMKRYEINEKMKEIIDFSEIGEHIDTPVKRYSSGMYVRLAFAVAANLESEVLIADEVLAVGDAQFQKKALGKMEDVSKHQGRTVIFVSHQMNAVKALCKSGIVLSQGESIYRGDINSAVSFYQSSLFSREEDGELAEFNNEFFDLLEFEIVNEDGKVVDGIVGNDEQIFVYIKFDVKKVHSGFCLGYSLYDKEGNIIYWSYPNDNFDAYNAPHLGENVIVGEIPTHFVNEDEYYVYLQGGIHFQEWLIDPGIKAPRRALKIQGGLSKSPFWSIRRPGICAPILKWKVIK